MWITNQKVAWQLPPGRIASFYQWHSYLPPEGWEVEVGAGALRLQEGWQYGEFGEMRRDEQVCAQ